MNAIGLDIGTTTLSAIVCDAITGVVKAVRVMPNDSAITADSSFERKQDPMKILDRSRDLIGALKEAYAPVCAIGLTGQMHGIVYIDRKGSPVSPLYTWQDGRGDCAYQNGERYAQYLSRLTNGPIAAGYGLLTHFYNAANNLVPPDAVGLCCIHDLVGMRLTGRSTAVMHASDAASLGLFDLGSLCFKEEAIKAAGIDRTLLPRVTNREELLGFTTDGIPVSVAIGDNQASFLGSVQLDQGALLINVGTGSQISVLSPGFVSCPDCETRPFMSDSYLLVGSSLCGGRAYALLAEFFGSVLRLGGADERNMYPLMNEWARRALEHNNPLHVDTSFSGTRSFADRRGSIGNIGLDNLTPEDLSIGILRGIAAELKAYYDQIKVRLEILPERMVGSGNGIRMNPVLRILFEQSFEMPMGIPSHQEEAAFGAALFSLVAAGIHPSIAKAQQLIRYD